MCNRKFWFEINENTPGNCKCHRVRYRSKQVKDLSYAECLNTQVACQVCNFNKALKCCGQFPSRSRLIRGRGPHRTQSRGQNTTANGNGVTSIIPSDICFWRRVHNGFRGNYCRSYTLGWLIYTSHDVLEHYSALSLGERLFSLFTY